jgi:hypothetical protein
MFMNYQVSANEFLRCTQDVPDCRNVLYKSRGRGEGGDTSIAAKAISQFNGKFKSLLRLVSITDGQQTGSCDSVSSWVYSGLTRCLWYIRWYSDPKIELKPVLLETNLMKSSILVQKL